MSVFIPNIIFKTAFLFSQMQKFLSLILNVKRQSRKLHSKILFNYFPLPKQKCNYKAITLQKLLLSQTSQDKQQKRKRSQIDLEVDFLFLRSISFFLHTWLLIQPSNTRLNNQQPKESFIIGLGMQRKVLKHGHNTKLLCNIAAAALNGLHLPPPTLFWLGDLGLFSPIKPPNSQIIRSSMQCPSSIENGTENPSFEELI